METPEFLTTHYYGNSVAEWVIAALIVAFSFMTSRIVIWAFKNVFQRLTAKTETKLDDIIVGMVERPAAFAVTVVGIWFGISTLELPEAATLWFSNVFQILLVLSAGWLVARLLDALYEQFVVPLAAKGKSDLDGHLVPVLRKATRIAVWSVTVVIALNNAGYDVGALLAGLGIGGLAVAMAAKDTVSNVFGGVTIFSDRPFAMKDRVKVSGYEGVVEEIGIRSTRLRTLEGRIVTIPNAKFTDAPVENVSSEPSRKIIVNLGLTYDTSPERMKAALDMLREVVTSTPNTLPTIQTGFMAFGPSSLDLRLIYYIARGADFMQVESDVNMAILERFAAAGLEFAFPTRTVFTKAA